MYRCTYVYIQSHTIFIPIAAAGADDEAAACASYDEVAATAETLRHDCMFGRSVGRVREGGSLYGTIT
jgi:hypothetical protein